ncbi:hypothetical protein JZ751_011298 [Albula glossodonta]|uniref:DUF4657 domain-containing protein n=1 Tax=Albula glossodonta TaxID=121402 RepID=A0A8T2NYM5_9TELE|nr:hypothetical protein JZ751_011298 [Albula glossodonta]
MSLKKRRASVVFNWQRSFTILAPWRKGKGDMVVDSEVVLTKMKIFNNFHEKISCSEDSVSTISMSVSEQDTSEPVKAVDRDNDRAAPKQDSSDPKRTPDYLSVFSDPQLPRLFKFESEDSGVELPSGANSPSTPTGSEHSFVVHSRESSCDSRDLNTSAPSPNSLLIIERCPETEETEDLPCPALGVKEEAVVNDSEVGLSSQSESSDVTLSQEGPKEGALGNVSEECKMGLEVSIGVEGATQESAVEDTRTRSPDSTGAYDDMTKVDLQQQPLRKSATSDSLDEYMDECCRLSEKTEEAERKGVGRFSTPSSSHVGHWGATAELLANDKIRPGLTAYYCTEKGLPIMIHVHQAKSNPLGSGLGYLEHICQLIEKIGQLQEHNLRLQKQICGLQKESKMKRTKEDFFLQHCCCGAASLAFQELKRHSRSEFYGLTASNATLSDLTTIPEVTRHPGRMGKQEGENGCYPVVPLWRKGLNRRSYTEGEARYLCDSTEALSAPHRRLSENYTWGRVKELVKKTRLKNQSRLGLSSSSLKRSCPQLYSPTPSRTVRYGLLTQSLAQSQRRIAGGVAMSGLRYARRSPGEFSRPDLGPVELPKRDRNSMIALGHQTKDLIWPHHTQRVDDHRGVLRPRRHGQSQVVQRVECKDRANGEIERKHLKKDILSERPVM